MCQLNEAWVLYFPLTDRLLILNATAKTVWDLLVKGYETREIASEFARDFGISHERAEQDVAQVLADLASNCSPEYQECVEADVTLADPRNTRVDRGDPGKTADCGVFRFGQSHIRIMSAVADMDGSFFARFHHRSTADRRDTDVLEILRSDSAYELRFRGRAIAEATIINRMMWHLVEFLICLEHPDQDALAYCHAGAVSLGGRSLLMPGNSGVGKSTLTGFLAAHGFAYLGDDLIAIGKDDLALLPLPTSLSIKAGSWKVLERFYGSLSDLPTLDRYGRSMRYVEPLGNYESVASAAAPSAIVFPTFCAGAPTRLTPLRPVETMSHLLEAHARLSGWEPATDDKIEDKLSKFVRFVEQTPAYELTYSELPDAMKTIKDLLASQDD